MSDAYEVIGLWRYPVKSMAGEVIDMAERAVLDLLPQERLAPEEGLHVAVARNVLRPIVREEDVERGPTVCAIGRSEGSCAGPE